MISKRIAAALAGTTTLSLVLAACGDNGGGAPSSSSGDSVKSLTILDYYNNDPDKSLVQKGSTPARASSASPSSGRRCLATP